MFERSLSSLIKGLRSHRGRDEAKYVATIMEEIKHEIRSADMDIKAEAVLKLTYLQMLGYSPSDASFHMLEVMSSPRYHLKTVGYLATSQCFSQETDVLILATNMVKKDLRSSNYLDVSIALNGLAHIVTPDLALHLAPDIITLLSHTKPVIRKKAILVLHAMIVHYPPTLQQALPRVIDKLQDSDTSVASSAVNIICELSRHDTEMAKAFLPASPQLFDLLTNSSNNWMLIKIVKLFGVLTPLEPRLTRRLLPPITSLIRTTPAMSLLYECIQTVIIGGMLSADEGDELAATCSQKFGAFLDDEDQNLRYIALLGLVRILPTHPHLVAMHQESIFQSMEDEDLTIRLRALDLVSGMASRDNFIDIVQQQLKHLDPSRLQRKSLPSVSAAASLRHLMANGTSTRTSLSSMPTSSWIGDSYRQEIVNRILAAGSADTYANIVDFEWYIDVLIRLNYFAGASMGGQICHQLIDISARVRTVRTHAIEKLQRVLEDFPFIESSKHAQELHILRAAAWICGEYCQEVAFPPALISLLIRPETLEACEDQALATILQNAVKLFGWWLLEIGKDWQDDRLETASGLLEEMLRALRNISDLEDIETRERVSEYILLLQIIEADFAQAARSKGAAEPPRSLRLLSPLFFSYSLGPVAKRAQSKVDLPEGIDLDEVIFDEKEYRLSKDWDEEGRAVEGSLNDTTRKLGTTKQNSNADKQELRRLEKVERARLRAEREKREQESPFYIGKKFKDHSNDCARDNGTAGGQELVQSVDDIPIVQLKLDGDEGELTAKDSRDAKASSLEKKTAETPVLEPEEMPEQSSTATVPVKVRKAKSSGNKKKRGGRGVNEEMLE